MRALIGCLQRRRHQPAAQAAGTESRTRSDGRMAGLTGEGRRGMKTRWVREVLWWRNAKTERWGSWRRSPDEQRDSSLLETVAWLTKFT